MILQQLSIERERYGTSKGQLTGRVRFGTTEHEYEGSTITLSLNPERCAGILAVVADALVATSKDVGALLTADVVESARMIEAPKATA